MASKAKRTYGDRCGIARALDVIGERWAVLVVRELLLGPKRFTDLRTGLPNVGPDMLAQRLRELEEAGVLRRRTLDPPAAARVYELTERGAALEPVILELGRWGSGVAFADEEARLGPDGFVLALKTMFDPRRAGSVEAVIGLRVSGIPYRVEIAAGEMTAVRGEASDASVRIEGDPNDLARLLWHDGGAAAVLASEAVTIEGARTTAKRFLSLFAMPRRAEAA